MATLDGFIKKMMMMEGGAGKGGREEGKKGNKADPSAV